MTIDMRLLDEENGLTSKIINNDKCNAVIVATTPLKSYTNKLLLFSNDLYGVDMNINTVPSGSSENIHNGTDDVYWTLTSIVGDKLTTNSTDRPYNGTMSVKWDNGDIDDTIQFAKGSSLTISDYISLTMWINVDKDWKAGDNITLYGWNTGTSLINGIPININDYFSYNVYDTWHKIVISLSDMELTGTIDSIRMKITTAEGKSPKFYMDDIEMIEDVGSAVPTEFKIEPSPGKWLHVASLHLTIADVYDGFINTGDGTTFPTMPNIPYDGFFSLSTLDAGITYKRSQDGSITNSATIKQLIDLMVYSSSEISGYGSDGTNSWVSIKISLTEKVILKSEEMDYLSLTVNDDLSDLLLFRMSAGCLEEDRNEDC